MKRAWSVLLILILALPTPQAFASSSAPAAGASTGPVEVQCAASVQLTSGERGAIVSFNSRLSGLWRHYGKDSFESSLRERLKDYDPQAKLIEVSPLFMEKILYFIDVYRLRHAIERTIGQDDKKWAEFERTMWSVVMHEGGYSNKHGLFDKKVEKLLLHIKNSDRRIQSPVIQYSVEQRKKYIDDAVLQLANMYVTLGRLSVINRQAVYERAEDASRKMAVMAIALVSGGVLVASTVYAGPIVVAAGLSAGSLSANAATAALLVKLGQVAAGAGLGIVGAPTGKLLSDSTQVLFRADSNSKNLRTTYSCEIEKQLQEMKNRGLKPYINAALAGGTIGLGGGLITLAGSNISRALLLVTSLGVGVAAVSSATELTENTIYSLAEYRLAMIAIEKGPEYRAEALAHLHKSREYAQAAGEVAVEGVIVAVLATSIGLEFKGAIIEGGAAIRGIFANSSDTLPMSLEIAKEAVEGAASK